MEKLLSLRTNTWAKKNKSKRSTVAYPTCKSVGILFCTNDRKKHDAIKKFVEQLESDGKEVEVLSYLPAQTENHEFKFDFFTKKDISFWGNYTSEQVTAFTQKSFDYLFNIDETPSIAIAGILAQSKAKCRVGKYNDGNNRFYELMVDVKNNDINVLVDEMYRYTSILT